MKRDDIFMIGAEPLDPESEEGVFGKTPPASSPATSARRASATGAKTRATLGVGRLFRPLLVAGVLAGTGFALLAVLSGGAEHKRGGAFSSPERAPLLARPAPPVDRAVRRFDLDVRKVKTPHKVASSRPHLESSEPLDFEERPSPAQLSAPPPPAPEPAPAPSADPSPPPSLPSVRAPRPEFSFER